MTCIAFHQALPLMSIKMYRDHVSHAGYWSATETGKQMTLTVRLYRMNWAFNSACYFNITKYPNVIIGEINV